MAMNEDASHDGVVNEADKKPSLLDKFVLRQKKSYPKNTLTIFLIDASWEHSKQTLIAHLAEQAQAVNGQDVLVVTVPKRQQGFLETIDAHLQARQSRASKQRVAQVNIIGSDTQAATTITQALWEKEPTISANIFSFHPNLTSEEPIRLTSNVSSYTALYCREHSRGCAPVIPLCQPDNHATQITVDIMPGDESVLLANPSDVNASTLMCDAAEKFCRDLGTRLKRCLNLTFNDVLTCYSNIKNNGTPSQSPNRLYQVVPAIISWFEASSRDDCPIKAPVLKVNTMFDELYAKRIAFDIAHREILMTKNPDRQFGVMAFDRDFLLAIKLAPPESNILKLATLENIHDFKSAFKSAASKDKKTNLARMWELFNDEYEKALNAKLIEVQELNARLTHENDALRHDYDYINRRLAAQCAMQHDLQRQASIATDEMIQARNAYDALVQRLSVLDEDPIYHMLQDEFAYFASHQGALENFLRFSLNEPYLQRIKAELFSEIDREIAYLKANSFDDPNKMKQQKLIEAKTELCHMVCQAFVTQPDNPNINILHRDMCSYLFKLSSDDNSLSTEAQPWLATARNLLGILTAVGLSCGLLFLSDYYRELCFYNHTQRRLHASTRYFEVSARENDERVSICVK